MRNKVLYLPLSRTSVPLWHGHHSPVPSSSSSVPMQESSRLVTPLMSRWHRPADTFLCRQCSHAPYRSESTITTRQILSSIRPRALDLQISCNLRPPPEALLSSPASSRGTQAIDRCSGLHLSSPSRAIPATVSCLSYQQQVT